MSDKKTMHLVLGGQVTNPLTVDFADLNAVDIVGVFANYEEAVNAWRSHSQRHVDDAMTKYVIVPLHKLLEPEE